MESLSEVSKFENSNIYTYPPLNSDSGSSSSTSDGGYKLASNIPKKRAGRRKFKETRHPVYRGIRKRNGDKWVCELRNKKSRLWLGTYPTAEMAARAHDVAALALRGKSACLNFADSICRLPLPDSSSDSDIRKAAVEAAEAFRPRESAKESEEWGRDCSDAESSSLSSWSSRSKVGGVRMKESDEVLSNEQSGAYIDEDAIFFMPQLLVDLADGLLLPPPTFFNEESRNLSFSCDAEIALWNY